MKSQAEKDYIKECKRAYKNEQISGRIQIEETRKADMGPKTIRILTGILEGETVLEDSYPVQWDYLYIVDDNGGKVIKSGIQGTIAHLKADLRKLGYKALNIYRCEIGKRNLSRVLGNNKKYVYHETPYGIKEQVAKYEITMEYKIPEDIKDAAETYAGTQIWITQTNPLNNKTKSFMNIYPLLVM